MTPIQETIINKKTANPPIWLMRQAGRYLPEFKQIRKLNPNFVNLCLDKKLSSECTHQKQERGQSVIQTERPDHGERRGNKCTYWLQCSSQHRHSIWRDHR